MSNELSKDLLRLLASNFSLYMMSLNFHWNVEDSRFSQLHEFFEENYKDLAEQNDLIAERIRQLGSKVPATLKNFLKDTILEEGKPNLSASQMLKQFASSYETIIKHMKQIIKRIDSADDPATVDILTELLRHDEKILWMINSHL
jgi:starvation-inducible DNA-binding protein